MKETVTRRAMPNMVLVLYLLTVFHVIQAMVPSPWDVVARINPTCTSQCDTFNLVQISAQNSFLSIHILFAASQHIKPSLLILQSSDPNAQPVIDYTALSDSTLPPSQSITLNGTKQSYGVNFAELIEYDDINNTAIVPRISEDPSKYLAHRFKQWNWALSTPVDPGPHPIKGDEVFKIAYTANTSEPLFGDSGHVKLEFMVSSADQRNPPMPRLKFVPGLTIQFELSLINLKTNFSQGRFGLRLGLISNDPVVPGDDFVQLSKFSINDEVTPGIFEMINIRLDERTHPSRPAPESKMPGFFQTKPLCYISERVREIKTSRDAKFGASRDMATSEEQENLIQNTLPYWFYGHRVLPVSSGIGFRLQSISFGTPEDGYYSSSNCVIWTASFGFGEPPIDQLSALMIGMITLSTVVILGSILFGTLLILYVRWRRRYHRFQPIIDSDSSPTVNT